MSGVRRVTGVTVAVAVAVVAVAGWVVAVRETDPYDTAQIAAVITVVAFGTQVAGLRIGFLRPRRWTGVLIQLVGLEALTAAARHGELGPIVSVFAAGWLVLCVSPVLLVWDRASLLPGRTERLLRSVSAAAVATCVVVAVPIVVAADGRRGASPLWWWTSAFRDPADGEAAALMAVHVAAFCVAAAAALAALVGRWLHALPAERAASRPVVVTASLWCVVGVVARVASLADPDPFLGANGSFVPAASLLLITLPLLTVTALVVAVIWFELVVPRLRRTEGDVLVGGDGGADIDDLVRWALSDPSARALFVGPDGAGWVDAVGRDVVLDDRERVVTVFRRGDAVVGAIEHDAALAAHPDTVELVATVAGLAVEESGLAARTRATVARTRRLTARLVGAADEARAEVATALRRGPVRELERVRRRVESGADLDEVTTELQAISTDVRRISHGVLPPVLAERGLRAALAEARVDCGRLPPSVEVTVFLVAKDDPSAAVTVAGSEVVVALSAPPSRPSLLDRIEVLGGRVEGARVVLPVSG